VGRSIRSDPLRKILRGARVGTKEGIQWNLRFACDDSSPSVSLRGATLEAGAQAGDSEQLGSVSSQSGSDVEVVGLDCQRLLDLQSV
jgi:hypothetical protein